MGNSVYIAIGTLFYLFGGPLLVMLFMKEPNSGDIDKDYRMLAYLFAFWPIFVSLSVIKLLFFKVPKGLFETFKYYINEK